MCLRIVALASEMTKIMTLRKLFCDIFGETELCVRCLAVKQYAFLICARAHAVKTADAAMHTQQQLCVNVV